MRSIGGWKDTMDVTSVEYCWMHTIENIKWEIHQTMLSWLNWKNFIRDIRRQRNIKSDEQSFQRILESNVASDLVHVK